MYYITDLHIHSKYSRATSPNMDLEHLDREAKIKGIQVLGTGDFTHPTWFKELKNKLHLVTEGIYQIKNSKYLTNFILTSELSCIYTKNGRCRRIHLVFLAPSLEIVEKINLKKPKLIYYTQNSSPNDLIKKGLDLKKNLKRKSGGLSKSD